MAFPISSVINGAFSIGNALMQNNVNSRIMSNFYKVQRYNQPYRQMARFRSAGLNPNLIYSQSNTSDAAPQLVAPQFKTDFDSSSELMNYQNIGESRARVKNLEEQNELLKEQTLYAYYQNTRYNELTDAQINEIQSRIDKAYKEIDNIEWSQFYNEKRFDWEQFVKSKELENVATQLGIDKRRLEETIREFNVSNRHKLLIYEFLKGLGIDEKSARRLGIVLKGLILSQISQQEQ